MNTENKKLRDELIALAEYASKISVSHSEIAGLCNISYDYLRQIRRGENATTHNSNKLLQTIIDAYRKRVRQKVEELEQIKLQ